jgi:hypothetical protein
MQQATFAWNAASNGIVRAHVQHHSYDKLSDIEGGFICRIFWSIRRDDRERSVRHSDKEGLRE